ncbi:hypothetical protein L1887_56502 [Cichorium endivia]|nr:hypothetical protein L1887_56502 [Cichorium endivia]
MARRGASIPTRAASLLGRAPASTGSSSRREISALCAFCTSSRHAPHASIAHDRATCVNKIGPPLGSGGRLAKCREGCAKWFDVIFLLSIGRRGSHENLWIAPLSRAHDSVFTRRAQYCGCLAACGRPPHPQLLDSARVGLDQNEHGGYAQVDTPGGGAVELDHTHQARSGCGRVAAAEHAQAQARGDQSRSLRDRGSSQGDHQTRGYRIRAGIALKRQAHRSASWLRTRRPSPDHRFPDHPLPTAAEAEQGDDKYGGCGDVPSVLDATIRTVLSCNTSNRNSAAAHRSLTDHFGRRNWEAIHAAPESELVEAIRCGGLANNKARTIKGILSQTMEKHGKLSLDHLHTATDDEIMQELVSFNGVGPKVASCVLAFCIGRQSMAVDTHVFRLCKSLGWVPEKANRDQTYYHLHERVPGHLKYPLHVLLIQHGKRCANCSAKGFATVKEEVEDEDEKAQIVDRPCPLKAAGLLGRKGKALKDAALKTEPDIGVGPSKDRGESGTSKVKTEESASVKAEDEVDYAAALSAARAASSG